jgi:hypothetical protein
MKGAVVDVQCIRRGQKVGNFFLVVLFYLLRFRLVLRTKNQPEITAKAPEMLREACVS